MFLRSHAKKQSTTTILDIPEEVFHTSLLPRLDLHDVLSLRSVCHRTKYLSEGYLRTHPLLKETVEIFLDRPDDDDMSLGKFLRASTIPKPVSRFRLQFTRYSAALQNPHLPEFLERYGPQIEELYVSAMSFLPKLPQQLQYFGAFPNLKTLTIRQWSNREPGVKPDESPLLQDFQNLTMIKLEVAEEVFRPVSHADTNFLKLYAELSHFWAMIRVCKSLEYLRLPDVIQYHPLLFQLQRILNLGHHNNFQVLDLIHCSLKRRFDMQDRAHEQRLLAEISDFSPDRKIKLLNVRAEYLADFSGDHLRRVANQIVSIINFKHDYSFGGIPLPDVSEIKNLVWPALSLQLRNFNESLTRALFPGLRKLSIAINLNAPGQSLEVLWSEFSNLEELSLKREGITTNPANTEHDYILGYLDDDLIFFGADRKRPAFLQLTELKVLTLEVGPNKMARLSNAVFSRILRHMGLRKLYLKSDAPITSFGICGIQALLSGRFRETIKDFPFSGWSLAYVRDEPFQRLAKKFTNPKS